MFRNGAEVQHPCGTYTQCTAHPIRTLKTNSVCYWNKMVCSKHFLFFLQCSYSYSYYSVHLVKHIKFVNMTDAWKSVSANRGYNYSGCCSHSL